MITLPLTPRKPSILAASIATVLAGALLAPGASAATNEFKAGTTWSNPADWTNGLPGSTDALLIDHGFVNPVPNLTLDGSYGVETLSFNTGADVFNIDASADGSTPSGLFLGGGAPNALGTTDLIDLSNTTTGTIDIGGTNGLNTVGILLGTNGNINIGNALATLDFGPNAGIAGTFNLSQSGPGTLILAGANTFGGQSNSFSLNGGTLDLNNSAALGDATNVFVINGGKLDNTSGAAITTGNYAQTWGGNFSFGGSNPLNLGTGAVTLAGNRTLIVNGGSTGSLTVGGVISGVGFGLTKAGNGTLSLTAANTFTGPVTVNGGILSVTTTGVAGAAQGIGESNSLVLNGGIFQFAGPSSSVNFAPTITIGPNGGTIDTRTGFLFYGGSFAGSGTLTVVNSLSTTSAWILYTGASPGFTGNIIIGDGVHTQSGIQYRSTNATPFGTGTITINSGGLLSADIGAGGTIPNSLILNGGIFGSQGSNVTYSGAITLQADSQIGSPPISNATGGVITVSGVISGSAALTKVTADNAILSGVNLNTGLTNVAGGTLTLGNILALQDSTLNYTAAGGALSFGTLTSAILGGLQGIQALTLQNAATTPAAVALSVGNNGLNTTYGGVLSGPGSLAKIGTGTLTLNGASTFTGATTVNNGTLTLDFSSAAGPANIVNSTANSSVLTLGGGTLLLNGAANATNSQQFNGLTVAPGSSSIQITPNATANTVALNVGAGLSRSVGGTVDLTLPAAGSATNGLATTAGSANTILTSSGAAFATVGGSDWAAKDASNTFVVGLSTIAGGYTPSTSTALAGNADIAPATPTTTLGGSTSISSLRFNQPQATTIANGTGLTLSTGGILVTSAVNANLSTISGGTLTGPSATDLVVIQNNPLAGLTISSTIANNGASALGLTKSGSGTLTLSAANTFTGPVTLNSGTVSIATVAANGSAQGLGEGTSLIFNGGTLSYTGPSSSAFNRGITIDNAGGTLNAAGASFIFLSGVISGTADGTFTKTGAQQLIISGNNTYNGTTVISTGEVQIRTNTLALGSSAVMVANGADLAVGGGTAMGNIPNSITLNGTTTGNGALQVNDGSTTATFAGPITLAATSGVGGADAFTISGAVKGAGGLTKLSANAITLSAINTFTGDTTVSAGSLILANTQALQNSTLTTAGVAFSSAVASHAFTLGGLSGSANLTLADNATTPNPVALSVGNNGAAKTYSGILSGAGSLNKIGAGTLTLTGANTFTGATIVTAGTLALSGTGNLADAAIIVQPAAVLDVSGLTSGSLSLGASQTLTAGRVTAPANDVVGNIASIGTLNVAGANTTGTLTIGGNLTLNGGTVAMDLGNTTVVGGGTNDLVNVAGLNLTASTGINIGYVSSTLAPGTYTLFNYSGSFTGNVANFFVVDPTRNTFAFGTTAPANGSVTLTVGGTASASANLVWAGDGTANVWDTATTANFLNGVTPDKFFTSDNVTFDDTGLNTPAVAISGLVQPGSLTVNNSVKPYTFSGSGSIVGPGSLTKNGASTLTISTANTFSGGTTLSAGQININNASALGTGPLVIAGGNIDNTSGAAIIVSGNNPQSWNADFTFGGSNALNLGTGAVTLSANRTLTINGSTLTVGGPISGAAALIKAGPGTLVLSGTNIYTGNTTVNAGILQIAATTASIPNNTTVTVSSGATFDVNGQNLNTGFTKPFIISGTGAANSFAALINSSAAEGSIGNLTLAGNATIGQSLLKLNIGGTVNGGGNTLTVVSNNPVSATNGGGNQTDIRLANGLTNLASVIVNGALRMEANQNWAGPFIVNSGGVLDTAGNETINGSVNLNGGATLSTLNNSSTWTGPITLTGTSTIIGNPAATFTLTLSGNIGGTGGFTKSGTAPVVLSGTNSYAGGTTISAGAILAGAVNALGTGGLQMTGGTLTLSGFNTAAANLSSTVTTSVVQDASANPATFTVGSDNTSTTYSSTIVNGTGAGVLSLTKIGNGALTLSGANTYTGPTLVSGGSLIVSGSLTGSATTVAAGTLAGTGTITGAVTVDSGASIAPGTSAAIGTLKTGPLTFSGGGAFALEINAATPASSLDQITGVLTLGSPAPALAISYLGGNTTLTSGTAFTFITYTGGWDGNDFSFGGNPIANGSTFSDGTNSFQLTYNGGASSNSVILTVVPEPGAGLNLLGASGMLAGLCRFRRRRA